MINTQQTSNLRADIKMLEALFPMKLVSPFDQRGRVAAGRYLAGMIEALLQRKTHLRASLIPALVRTNISEAKFISHYSMLWGTWLAREIGVKAMSRSSATPSGFVATGATASIGNSADIINKSTAAFSIGLLDGGDSGPKAYQRYSVLKAADIQDSIAIIERRTTIKRSRPIYFTSIHAALVSAMAMINGKAVSMTLSDPSDAGKCAYEIFVRQFRIYRGNEFAAAEHDGEFKGTSSVSLWSKQSVQFVRKPNVLTRDHDILPVLGTSTIINLASDMASLMVESLVTRNF